MKPILRNGAEPPTCNTLGCWRPANFLCVWGCLEEDIHDGYYCGSCAHVKAEAVQPNSYVSNIVCRYGHKIADYTSVRLDDPWRGMYDCWGMRIDK